MNHRRISVFLLLAGLIAMLGILWVFGIYVPLVAQQCALTFSQLKYLYWPALLYLWGIGLLFLAALANYLLISVRIGRNQSFCTQNADGLRTISVLLFIAAALCIAGLAAGLLPRMSFGIWCIPVVLLSLASGAMGMLAWALGWLLRRAVQLQEENDLTI